MNNKPLIAAAVFAVAGLAFLIYSWSAYSEAAAAAQYDLAAWQNARPVRIQYAELRAEYEALDTTANVPGNPDLIAVLGELRTQAEIPPEQMTIRNERVSFDDVSMQQMGRFFAALRQQHGYLVVRNIRLVENPEGGRGHFNWNMTISLPETD